MTINDLVAYLQTLPEDVRAARLWWLEVDNALEDLYAGGETFDISLGECQSA